MATDEFKRDFEIVGVSVRLPHQCDEWEITYESQTREEAIESMESFVFWAQCALEKLRRGETGKVDA